MSTAAAMKTINGHGAKFGDASTLGIVAIKLLQASVANNLSGRRPLAG